MQRIGIIEISLKIRGILKIRSIPNSLWIFYEIFGTFSPVCSTCWFNKFGKIFTK
jgi:hypothetical protein